MSKLRSWFSRRARSTAEHLKPVAPLREFVYLDEVSVYSLLASRRGAITKELAETESVSLQDEHSATAGVSAGLKSELAARSSSTSTSGTHVVRKSIVQGSFKELVELEKPRMLLPSPHLTEATPKIPTAEALEALGRTEQGSPWLIDAATLHRGALFELEIELEAAPAFAVTTAVASMVQIMEENPEMFANERDGIAAGKMADRVFGRLLAGLVPVRGRAIKYDRVMLGGKEWLIHTQLLQQLGFRATLETMPVYIVGVAERDLFWKDIRRVLFSHSRFWAMCRLGKDGLQDTWSPVKLIDIFQEVVPQVAPLLAKAPQEFLDGMRSGVAESLEPSSNGRTLLRTALRSYAHAFTTHYGKNDIEPPHLEDEEVLRLVHAEGYGTVEELRSAFAPLTERLRQLCGVAPDLVLETRLRTEALDAAGLGLNEALPDDEPTEEATETQEPGRLLDVELVAIYW